MSVAAPTQIGTFLDAVAAALERAGGYNRGDQDPPAAVLWTDKERQWEPMVPRLSGRLPMFTLGAFEPDNGSGPAYWLRCVIGRTIADPRLQPTQVPVLYLPGYSRQELRAVENCPRELQPLAELQYRGVLWTHPNGRDWTVAAFLQNQDLGLALDLGADDATKEALLRALSRVADEPVQRLQEAQPLRAEFFDELLHPDDARDMLLWLNDPEGYRNGVNAEEWRAFRAVCKTQYKFDPEQDGPVSGAKLLGSQEGKWDSVWRRYADAAPNYPNIPALLEKAGPRQLGLFEHKSTFPQANEVGETALSKALAEVKDFPAALAGQRILELEAEHAPRRTWVWARLGQAPLALALEHLAELAKGVRQPLGNGSVADISARYAEQGWRVDRAALDALACVALPHHVDVVKGSIRALYRDWLESGARALQETLKRESPPTTPALPTEIAAGTCLLFTDGLRFDLAARLQEILSSRGMRSDLSSAFAALPSVTATAKPAISPVASAFGTGDELTPKVNGVGRAVNVDVLRTALMDDGWGILRGDELGNPSGRAWAEYGNLDRLGHEFGSTLAHHAGAQLESLSNRVHALLQHGWERVIVITDHGWLLLPGGLPKVELPEHLTTIRKGRCARLREGATSDQQTVPWRWDKDVRIVVAPGICCYEAGREYEHGGISPQECVVPVITVTPAVVRPWVVIESVEWTGLRCRVKLSGTAPGAQVDIRTAAANSETSIVQAPRPAESEQVSLMVPDDGRLDTAAVVVVIQGADVIAQTPTLVGQGE